MTDVALPSDPSTGDDAPLLQLEHVSKHYPVYSKGLFKKQIDTIKACDDISFTVRKGETLGIVGESGSGKTTLGRAILRAVRPSSGHVWYQPELGPRVDLATLEDAALKPLRREVQMIFQDPFSSLNPRWTVQQIIAEPLVIHAVAQGQELEDRVAAMMKRVGVRSEYRNRYPHAFSGGQRQRIGIARALIMNPRLVIADEAVSALDVSVQAQVINLLSDLQDELGLTYLFIAHDLAVVRHICDRVAVMKSGRLIELRETEALFDEPQHEYTKELLSAVLEVSDAHQPSVR
jgi:ABC-type oligopeptide transport system ATPase subunit